MKQPTSRSKGFILLLLCSFALPLQTSAEIANLVSNGGFETSTRRENVPDDWSTAGNQVIRQQLSLDPGRAGGQCAKLVCTEFRGDGPDYHVMLCQAGKVGLRRDQWYRLTFWARAEGLKSGIDVGLSDTRTWQNTGLNAAFAPGAEWRQFETLFRARQDLLPADSRLQFWFKGTGTLWIDDVELIETDARQQWFPQIPTDGVKNLIPNSSFECGPANWGSLTYGLSGWAGNLYRLEGQLDGTTAHHGKHSLKISLHPENYPVFYFDYYDPIRQPVRRVLAANLGWFVVESQAPLTLSVWLRADSNDTAAQLVMKEAPDRIHRQQVLVGTEWRRYEFTLAPGQPFVFIAVGLDLEASKRDSGTLWVDAVQLEPGKYATDYAPRAPVESFLTTDAPDNIFTNPASGLRFTVRAFNNSETPQTVRGQLRVRDFFDQETYAAQSYFEVPAHSAAAVTVTNVGPNQLGYFNATWSPSVNTQALRCAVILPLGNEIADSPLGFNHAYPWDFLVRSAQRAGIVWWRDWSAKWQTVEPEKGKFNFQVPDAQIHRVRALGGQVQVLLPFPSSEWATTAVAEQVEKAARGNEYLRKRLPVAFAPKELRDFGNYAAAVARHYASRGITHFQILNEPVYTDYALPRSFGYHLPDYLQLLQTAAQAIRATEPSFRIVGGISAGVDAGFTRDFIQLGGLQFLDVFDLHVYDPPRSAESFHESFATLASLIHSNGGPKPVWITEWGCYADDDPPCFPRTIGDDTMNRCGWPDERSAAEHIIKFTAVSFAHGIRKIFFHAGTCGTINGPDAGGVLFEYGGTPRKMYPAVAVLSRLLSVPHACLSQTHADGLHLCVFAASGRVVGIGWSEPGKSRRLRETAGVTARDIMGNLLPPGALVQQSPVYLIGHDADAIRRALE